jgi:phage gp29-like protein
MVMTIRKTISNLLDQFGRPWRQEKQPEKRPLAAAPILDSIREYVSGGLTPKKLSSLLKAADAGDVSHQAELFDQMEEKDAHLLGEAEKRRNAILDVEFQVEPASDDKRDADVAEFVQEYFDNTTDWDDTLVTLQDSVGKGFSALEINWDISEGQAIPKDLEFIEQKRFRFADSNGHLLKYPLLLSDNDPMGAEIPPWKILFHRYGGKAGHATRSGIYRVCTWMFLFRNYALKDWLIFLEVFGMPLRLGKFDSGANKEDKDALVTAIRSLGSDAAGIISKNTEIEFIEAVKSGGTKENPYRGMLEFCAKEISKALLGQTLTADVGDVGSYAAANTHNEVRLDLAKADTKAVAATTRYQLIRPMVGFNFGWETPVPGYKAIWNEREDLKNLSEVYKTVISFGQPVAAEHVSDRFGIPLPEKDQTVLQPVSGGMSGLTTKTPNPAQDARTRTGAGKSPYITAKNDTGAQFDAEQQEIEELADDSLNMATEAWNGIDGPLKKLIAATSSLEELRDRIFEVYKDMDPADLEELMRNALVTAALGGAADASKSRVPRIKRKG